ncbi:uncharacterized protein LOC144783960 [Lissotriton helveticus]
MVKEIERDKIWQASPRGKRRTQEEEEGAVQDAGQDRAGEGSFAGPSGTSGGGASAEVVVLDEDSGEEAVQVPDVPVRVHTVVAGRVAPSKSTRPSRREQARMARQRRLDATVAEYRRLVALEEEDTQSTGTTTTTSTGTAASSSVPPRAASQRSAPAVRSRATKANRHRRAAKTPAAPHRSCKARQRRLSLRVSYLEQEYHMVPVPTALSFSFFVSCGTKFDFFISAYGRVQTEVA